MLDHKKIKIIKTINSFKSISEAANNLYTAQPNLSRNLKNIEDELGFEIFDRSKVPLKLTDKGIVLFDYIKKFENLEKLMNADLEKISKKNPTLKIGALTFMSQYILPEIIPEFINIYPHLDVILKKYDSLTFEQALMKHEIDLFITNRKSNNKNLLSMFIVNDPIYLMYPKDNTSKNFLNLNDFSNSTFYLLNQDKNMRKAADEIFKKNNFYPKNIKLVSNIMNGVSLVRAKKGVTFVYETSLKMINSYDYCDFLKIYGEFSQINISYKDRNLENTVNDLSKIIKNFITLNYSKN